MNERGHCTILDILSRSAIASVLFVVYYKWYSNYCEARATLSNAFAT